MQGRSPKPWYRAAQKTWYVILDGRWVNLGPDKAEAFRRFHLLMAGEPTAARPDTSQAGSPLTFAELVGYYLANLKTRTADSTFKNARGYLAPFVRSFGTVAVDKLRKQHVDDAIAQHGKWNVSSERYARSRLLAVLNWAVRDQRIAKNPLAGLWMPTPRSRGAEVVADAATTSASCSTPLHPTYGTSSSPWNRPARGRAKCFR